MAVISGLGSSIALLEETTWGTVATPAGSYLRLPYISGGLERQIDIVESNTLEAGNLLRTTAGRRQGNISAGGPLQMLLYNQGIGGILKWMTGSVALLANTPVGFSTNTYTLANALVSNTVEIGMGGVTAVPKKTYTGAVVDSWAINVAQGSNATLGLTLKAKDEAIVVSGTLSGAAPVVAPSSYNFLDASVTVGGVTSYCVREISIQGDNASLERRCLGTALIAQPLRNGFAKVTGSFTAEFDGLALYNAWVADSPTTITVVLSIAGTTNKTLTFNMNTRLIGKSPMVSGPEVITVQVPYEVIVPSGSTDASAFSIVTVN